MSTQGPVAVCDLDGVIWLADTAIEGAAGAVAALRAAGYRLLFVTNNSFAPVAEVEAKLASMGVPAVGDVVTSAMAAAQLVDAGERVMLAGGPGAREELERRQARIVETGPVDVVVVGFHRTFDYEELTRCAAAVRAGARLIGTNGDATYPTPDGEIPGGGAILAAVATAAGVDPVVAGKPHEPMAALVRTRVGEAPLVMLGDRLDTDGLFAERLGARFVHVLSGVHPLVPDDLRPNVWLEAADLAAAVPRLTGHGS
jgi:HAD superfamily hydrolase (TIGR01450 family)